MEQAGISNRGSHSLFGCPPRLQVQHLDVRLALLRRLLRLRRVHVRGHVDRQHLHQSHRDAKRLHQLRQRPGGELVQRRHLAVRRLSHRRRRLDALHLRCARLGLGLGLGLGAAPLARRTPNALFGSRVNAHLGLGLPHVCPNPSPNLSPCPNPHPSPNPNLT